MSQIPYRLNISPMGVFESNTTINLRCNKVLIKNMSNYIVYLFRIYTLLPGQEVNFGSENDDAVLETEMELDFASEIFDDTEDAIKRVEVLAMFRIGKDHAFQGTPAKDFDISFTKSTS